MMRWTRPCNLIRAPPIVHPHAEQQGSTLPLQQMKESTLGQELPSCILLNTLDLAHGTRQHPLLRSATGKRSPAHIALPAGRVEFLDHRLFDILFRGRHRLLNPRAIRLLGDSSEAFPSSPVPGGFIPTTVLCYLVVRYSASILRKLPLFHHGVIGMRCH